MYTKKFFRVISISFLLAFLLASLAVADVTISNIVVANGKAYQVGEAGIDVDTKYYIDRDYVVLELPDKVKGAQFIMTGNDEKNAKGADFLCFEVDIPATVWVAHDSRGEEEKGGVPPAWLANEFERDAKSPLTIKVTDGNMDTFVLWEKDFPAGKVCLAGNADDPAAGHGSNYLVLVTAIIPAVNRMGKLSSTWGAIKNR